MKCRDEDLRQSPFQSNTRGNVGRSLSLVTGGAGFVGSHIVDALLARGESVVVIDDLSTGRMQNLDSAFETGRCAFIYGDLAECSARVYEMLEAATSRPLKSVFHFASSFGHVKRPWEALATSGPVTMDLITLALRHQATFVFGSTAGIYGDPLVQPQPESYFGNSNPIGELSCFNEAYRFGEAAVSVAVRGRNLDGKIVRLFDAYGPRMSTGNGQLLSAVLNAALGKAPSARRLDASEIQLLTYIEDVVEAILLVTATSSDELRPVNIGTDLEHTAEQLIAAVAKVGECDTDFCELDTVSERQLKRLLPDVSLARSYGWAPTTSLEDGLHKTISSFRGARLVAVR